MSILPASPNLESTDQSAKPKQVIQIKAKSSARLTMTRLLRDPACVASAIVIISISLVAIFAPAIAEWAGHGPTEQFRETGLSSSGIPVGPNGEFLFGTDQLGRDFFVRLAYGARISLIVGVAASLVASFIGVLIGATAGFFGGKVDAFLSRFIDLVLSVPFLLVAIALVAVLGPSLGLSISVIVFFSWAGLARVIRGQVIAIREREYIESARSLGESRRSMIFHDVLPNLIVPIIVYTTLGIPAAIVFEATLSFLGLGIVPPTPSWGNMLADAAKGSMYLVAPWMVLVPGLALLALTLAFNLLGDGLSDATDPSTAKGKKL